MSEFTKPIFRVGVGSSETSPRINLATLSDPRAKRLVTVRAALRAYPGVGDIGNGAWGLGSDTELHIRLHSLRAIFVSWAEFLYDGIRQGAREEAFDDLAIPLARLDEGLPDFYSRNIMGSDYACNSWQEATHAARRAVALVEAIRTLEFRTQPFDEDTAYRDVLDTLSLQGPAGHDNTLRWRAAQRSAIATDCDLLASQSMTLPDLALAPLWPDFRLAALETNLTLNETARDIRQLGSRLATWLRERKDGCLVLGTGPEEAAERLSRTANLPRYFWTAREPKHTLYAFDYCLHGALDNPHWGSETSNRPSYLPD